MPFVAVNVETDMYGTSEVPVVNVTVVESATTAVPLLEKVTILHKP